MLNRIPIGLVILLAALLWVSAGCEQKPQPLALTSPTAVPLLQKTSTNTPHATESPSPTAPPTQITTPTQAIGSPTATPPAATPTLLPPIVSPLEGIALDELITILSQPYQPPPPGEDTGHHGADFAYWRRGDEGAILGKPVMAALGGRVVAVMANRPPFGHAVIIETPLNNLPGTWVAELALPPAPSPLPTISRLPCVLTNTQELLANPEESIYSLYAHLNLTPTLHTGQVITLGAQIGEVGNSGYSSAPHLHLEVRVGPANYTPGSLAFYEVATTDSERYNYCLWRVSGVFRSFDPLALLNAEQDIKVADK